MSEEKEEEEGRCVAALVEKNSTGTLATTPPAPAGLGKKKCSERRRGTNGAGSDWQDNW